MNELKQAQVKEISGGVYVDLSKFIRYVAPIFIY